MSMELIKNIKSLTIIQLKQKKNIIIGTIAILGAIMLLSILDMIFYLNEEKSLFTNISSGIPGLFFGILIAIILMSKNIVSNSKISMYPGTSISRFISRIFSDHIYIAIIFIFSFLLYCIQYPIMIAISKLGVDISTAFAFDIKYALVGTLNIISYYLMAYGISVLIFSFATKLGTVKTIILYVGIFSVIMTFIRLNLISFDNVISYFSQERNLGIFILKTWSIWLITIFLSFLGAINMKVMYEELSGIKLTIISVGLIILMTIIFGANRSSFYSTYHSESFTAASKFKQLKETYIYKETLVECNNLDIKKMQILDNAMYFRMSESDALKEGILEKDHSLHNEFLVVTFLPADKYNNRYIFEYYLENMTITYEDSLLKYSYPKTKTVLNFLWGDSYKFLDSYNIIDKNSINTYPFQRKQVVYVIAPDSITIK